VTPATLATVIPINTPSVATVATVTVTNTKTEPDFLLTLATDSTELKTLITDLCRIVGYTEEAQGRMMEAYRALYPFQVPEQRDYFRQQVEMATAGKYWGATA